MLILLTTNEILSLAKHYLHHPSYEAGVSNGEADERVGRTLTAASLALYKGISEEEVNAMFRSPHTIRPHDAPHGLAEQLRPPTSRMVQCVPIQLEGLNKGMVTG